MKKSLILIPVVILAVVILLGVALYQSFLRPEALRGRVQHALEERFQQKVVIKEFTIDLWHRPRVTLEHIELESPEEYALKADGVVARFSPLYLLLGRVKIWEITLQHPTVVVNLERINLEEKTRAIPRIKTHDGHALLRYKGREIAVDNIRGTISSRRLKIEADMLGGTTRVAALKIGDTWKGRVEGRHLSLESLSDRLHGVTDLAARFETDTRSYRLDLSLEAEGLGWRGARPLSQAAFTLALQGDKEALFLTDIRLKSPLVNVSGAARILNLAQGADAVLDLDLHSDEFTYNDLAACLPTRDFPAWLHELLARQIRDGRSRFKHLRYQGYLYEMTRWDSCFRNLAAELTINGQSFGLPGARRVTGATGRLLLAHGTLALKDLSARMGTAPIRLVNIKFPHLDRRGLRLLVEVALDMPAADFMDAWRASVYAPEVRQLLDPVRAVQGGRVRGDVQIFYENVSETAVVRGHVDLAGCTLAWDKVAIRGLTGTAAAADYGDPARMRFACTWDATVVDDLTATLSDPLREQYFTYVLKARGLPAAEEFGLAKDTTLKLNGTGKWPDLEGDLVISTRGVSLFGHHLQPRNGPITGRGILTAQLDPEFSLSIPDLAITPEGLHCQIGMRGDQAHYKVAGKVNLATLQATGRDTLTPLDGVLTGVVSIDAGAETRMHGSVDLGHSRLAYKGKPMLLAGLLVLDGDRIRSTSLRIRQDQMTAEISGTLALGDNPHLSGEVSLDGLKIGAGGDGDFDIPRTFSAAGRLTLTDASYYGIPITYGTAQAEVKAQAVRLVNMDLSGPAGTVQGSTMRNPDGSMAYDLNLELRNTPIAELIKAMAPTAVPWMDGTMDLRGHLWGRQDLVNGDVVFKARQGRIHRYNLLSRVFSVLNPYKMIKSGAIDFLKDGFPYNTISASFTLRDSVMRFEDFALDSNSLQVSGVGKYTITTKHLDTILGIQPLETFDKTISQIPVVGWILTGDKGTLIVVSLRVRGPVDDTAVQLLPANTISKPVAESLLRILKLPVDILTKPGAVVLPRAMKGDGTPAKP